MIANLYINNGKICSLIKNAIKINNKNFINQILNMLLKLLTKPSQYA